MRRLWPDLSLLLMILLTPLWVDAVTLRPEFQNLENLYLRGELAELKPALLNAKPTNDEEHALQTHLSAMTKTRKADTIILLQQAIDRFPGTFYGQMSLLERAKIHLLERETGQAQALLLRIKAPEITERFYWLGVCADALNEHNETISHAENYLRLEPRGKYVGEAYYLVAGAYQEQKKYQSGISTLYKLESQAGHPQNPQYFHYRLGMLYQLADNHREALLQFKTGFELNRNSQIAFQIEDQLFELKARHGAVVDISFLYPYTEMEIPLLPVDPTLPPPDLSSTLKLDAKPQDGFFVQAGRFGVEANARQLAQDIRNLNIMANYFEDKSNKSTPWVVVSGPYLSRTEADAERQNLLGNSIECFVTHF